VVVRSFISLIVIFLLLLLYPSRSVKAQNGANLQFGPVLVGDLNLASFSDTAFLKKGYRIGVDARIGPYGFYLSPGLHYYGIDIESSTGFNFFNSAPKYHIIKGPINLGYKMFISRKVKFRVQGGIDVNYVLLIDDNDSDIGFKDINDAYFGLNLAAGIDFSHFTIDLNYESGLTNALKDNGNSKFNYLSAALGYFF